VKITHATVKITHARVPPAVFTDDFRS
jgi:hypothetical protein